jgi:hypothetical protein
MTLAKLAKQLRREAANSPKKAVALALSAIVAVWFWAPLMTKWVAAKEPATDTGSQPSNASAAPAALPAQPTVATAAGEKKAELSPGPWQDVVRAVDADPCAKPAGPLDNSRDPFQTPVETVPVQKSPAASAAKDVTPQSLNLVLTGTILGPAGRVARINGRTYETGATLHVNRKDGSSFDYLVTEIGARRVSLSRAGKQYELKIQAPKSSGQIELLGRD